MKVEKYIYDGPTISTNTVRGSHYRKYLKKINAIKLTFKVMIKNSNLPVCKRVWVRLFYNTRHDVDGLSFMYKIFVDEIVKLNKLPDDAKKYNRLMYIRPDENLRKGTIIFKVYYEPKK